MEELSSMSKYQLINGCRLDETLSIYIKLMSYSDLKLDMAVLPNTSGQEVVLCTFDYEGLKIGLEICSQTGACRVCCFVKADNTSIKKSLKKEIKCPLGNTKLEQIYEYFELRKTENTEFKHFYKPSGNGLSRHINMRIHL